MITHTITELELAWTLIAFIGLMFQLALVHRTIGDYGIAVSNNDGLNLRSYTAMTSVLIFVGGTLTQLAYVILGVIAMTQPSPHAHITVANYFSGTTFVSSSIISMLLAAIIYRRRVNAFNKGSEQ